MKLRFPYLVTRSPDLGKKRFETSLSKKVFPKVQLPPRRNLRGIGHELRDLGTRGGRSEYLWLIEADLFGGTIEAPALSDLQAKLGTLGTVIGPIASVTVARDRSRAIIDPIRTWVAAGGRMIWSFAKVPPGYRPSLDFVAYRPFGGKVSKSFEPPFEELTQGAGTVTGAYASGPDGFYWYDVSLVPDRRTGKNKVLRLECAPRSWFDGRHAAGLEVGNPPTRG